MLFKKKMKYYNIKIYNSVQKKVMRIMNTTIKIDILRKKIRDLRKIQKLSGTRMAEEMNKKYNIGLNKTTISKWEKGSQTPSTEYISYLCDFFKVDANWLLGLKK